MSKICINFDSKLTLFTEEAHILFDSLVTFIENYPDGAIISISKGNEKVVITKSLDDKVVIN